jgi:hypothetical protein
MTKHRIILIGVVLILAVAVCFSAELFAAELDPENPEWLFEERNDAEGWGNQNAMTIIGVEDGVLKLETTGTDPYIFCGMIDHAALVWAAQPPYLNVDADEHPILYAGMSLSENNNKVAFYYVTEDDAQWSERQVKRWENLVPTGEMEQFEFEMEWNGTITGLRMDFSDVAGIEIEIDYLSFVGHPGEKPGAVGPSGKVAAAWAEIKRGI